jgi:hypothetical protein
MSTRSGGARRREQGAKRRAQINAALDALLADHDRRAARLGRLAAAAVLVAAGRLLLMDLPLRERVRVERRVEALLP